jgi:hypothetical protein
VIALAREYPSIWGRPVIRAVDARVFTLRYFRRCLDCSFCNDQCCTHGVDIDVDNAVRLLNLGEGCETYVGVARADWFDAESFADAEFPSGSYRRTRTRDGHCVFHTLNGRGCKIHAWCLERGLDYHALKPLVSTLFPLTFEMGALVPSNEILESSLVCAGSGDSLYDGARDELIWFFGQGLADELDCLRRVGSGHDGRDLKPVQAAFAPGDEQS